MKKCPFCKAEIEDTARFCLYCMRSFTDKEMVAAPKKRRFRFPLLFIGISLVAALVIALLLFNAKDDSDGGAKALSGTGATSTQTSTATPSESEPEETVSDPTEDTKPAIPEASSPDQPAPPEDDPTEPPVSEPDDPIVPPGGTEDDNTEPEQPATAAVYSYRDAKAGDDFNYHYTNPGDHIVITGIAAQSPDGVYDIPAYIDGKKVIAITKNAFSGSNAKVVYIPDTMKTIWNYAFAGCQVTDVYFRGSSVYMEGLAFVSSEVLTIHCSAECTDRNFRYYKDYPALSDDICWEEWNG